MKRPIKSGKLSSGGFSLNVLTDDEVYEIHLGTLEILKTTGVYVESEEARLKPMKGVCSPMTSTIQFRPCTMQKPL